MELNELQRNWEEFGRRDPMWAILTEHDKRGGKWDEAEFFANGRALVDAILEQLAAFDLPRQRLAALDFGCGLGRLTQAMAPHFEHATGVDIAASMITGACERNRHGARCSYLHNARDDLQVIDSASIDFVLSLLVLQHMRTEFAQGYIREFLRVLRPGGVAVFQVPYAARDGYEPGAVEHGNEPRMEMHATPRAVVEELVAAAGCRIVARREDDGVAENWPSCVYVVTR